jgi:hypothetical protein
VHPRFVTLQQVPVAGSQVSTVKSSLLRPLYWPSAGAIKPYLKFNLEANDF